MKCHTVRRRLSQYLDADLPAHEQAAVAAHLDTCADCRAEAAALKRAESALRTLAAVQSAPELTADLRRRLAASPTRRLSWRWAGAGLAAAAVAALLFWLSPRTPPAEPQPPPAQVATTESPRIELPAASVVEPEPEAPAPPPPRPAPRHVAERPVPRPHPVPEATAPEPTADETATPEPAPVEAEEKIAGVILLVGMPQPPAPSSSYYLEITLPDGSKSVDEQSVERDADGRPRAIRIACHRIPPETGAAN